MKRIVTGHDADGASIITHEAEAVPVCLQSYPGYRSYELWSTDGPRVLPHGGTLPGVPTYFPSEDGSVFRISHFPPEDEGPGIDVARAVEELPRVLPGLLEHVDGDDPGMHASASVDYNIILSGELILEVDNGVEVQLGAGDVVIQNGTRHAWRNRSGAPAAVASILLGAQRAGAS